MAGKQCLWLDVLISMSLLTSYEELVAFCEDLKLPPLPDFTGKVIPGLDFVDRIASGKIHHCNAPIGFVPVQTGKDGNCFCRALSKIVFNKESEHGQIRCEVRGPKPQTLGLLFILL